MASARVEIVQPEPPPRKVILELTEEEAGKLLSVIENRLSMGPGPIYHALRPLFLAMGSGDYKLKP